ncbi:serpin family protein [Streptomyces sp. CdTB01]|uniref:serpin family protein n=1 Tax=Streptomyces sp. CdTB01 TaxID=1725411 RepID=UPI00073AE13D|nr:serpin family protein [Streptomyces sp. CdTB01]ALV33793.1 proteinase inhibitor I4 serpin [Streptomyces sp. CdTB01]
MRITNRTIRAVNDLTARWAAVAPAGTVFSAAGVWPLLGLLADGAGGAARTELVEALGVPDGQTGAAARELLGALGAMRGVDSALGLWTRRTLELRDSWEAGLPAGAHGALTADPAADRAALDAWAAERTGGLIRAMPVPVREDTDLVLASALALRTRWLRPFTEIPREFGTGPWSGRTLLGLHRRTGVLDRIGVADTRWGHVTELKVLGDNAVDVHLLLGEERMTPGQVLAAGVDVLARRCPVLPGPALPYGEAGPGLRVVKERSTTPDPPSLDVETVAFELTAEHELLARPEVFGLATAAQDGRPGPFPGVSADPLYVASARQSAMARFHARGFEAAAVTAFGMPGGAMPRLRWTTTVVEAVYDRPFGFLALHRHSRLVLAAGWVTDPEPYPEEDPEDTEEYR